MRPALNGTTSGPAAKPASSPVASLRAKWRQVPWSHEQLVRCGVNGSARGLTLQETILEYATSRDHDANGALGQRLERAAIVASGWFENSVPHEGIDACTDAATGLATSAYLRARLLDIHRIAVANRSVTARRDRHNLIVITPPPTDLSAEAIGLGVVARAVRPHLEPGMTAARCGPRSIVIVIEAGHDAPSLLRAIRAALVANSAGTWRVWSEPVVANAAFLGAQLHEIAVAGQALPSSARIVNDTSTRGAEHPCLRRSATGLGTTGDPVDGREVDELDDVRRAVNANAPLRGVLAAFAAAWHERAATFDEVVAELRSLRELISPSQVERFDHANTIAAICGPCERDAGQVEISAARDHLTGLNTGAYLDRRLQELAPNSNLDHGELFGPSHIRCDITLAAPSSIAELGPRLRLARTVQRIFDSAELLAGPTRDTITIVVDTAHDYDKSRRRLDLLLAESWACDIVVDVQEMLL